MAKTGAERTAEYTKRKKAEAADEIAGYKRKIEKLEAEIEAQKKKSLDELEIVFMRGVSEILGAFDDFFCASVMNEYNFTKPKLQAAAALYFDFLPYTAMANPGKAPSLEKLFAENGKIDMKYLAKGHWKDRR
ncbi:MAG: hypothetical protein Ta2A_19440 [Treponemataceae bacterium]|nr:MAG: hypothetical protein Ta2A_19440 [Treponemataceae bacterium]